MAYATVGQYESRYGAVSDESMLKECLEDASAVIDSALADYGIDAEGSTDEYSDKLMRVCRSMANRIMPRESEIPQGATSASMSAVGFTESFSFASTYGTPKLLPSEMKMLGIGSSKYRSVQARCGADEVNV